MSEERTFQIRAGMDVVDPQGEPLGSLESILTETRTGMSRFITVQRRILPVETIQEVEGENIRVAVAREKLDAFPEREGARIPTEDDMQRAYEAFGMSGPLRREP